MDRRRYWYWIHPRILKYAWKWKSKTCFNTPDGWSNFATNIIYDAILIALTRRGFLYLALPITPCALTFPSLETSCKPLRRREVQEYTDSLVSPDTNTCRSGAMLAYKFYPLHNLCFILSYSRNFQVFGVFWNVCKTRWRDESCRDYIGLRLN